MILPGSISIAIHVTVILSTHKSDHARRSAPLGKVRSGVQEALSRAELELRVDLETAEQRLFSVTPLLLNAQQPVA
jgi:hypothetical protein